VLGFIYVSFSLSVRVSVPVIYACHDSSSYTRLMLFRSKFHVSRVSAAIGVIYEDL